MPNGIIIDEATIEFDFDIMRDDLRDFIFKEDEISRYRERIIDKIRQFGIEKWFKAKGYPTNPESVWKNRYTGEATTLNEQCSKYEHFKGIEEQGYYLWENYLPEAIWNDKDLMLSYKVGTKEYYDRMKEYEIRDKKYKKKNPAFKEKSQKPLFDSQEVSETEMSASVLSPAPLLNPLDAIKKESICPIIEVTNEEIKGHSPFDKDYTGTKLKEPEEKINSNYKELDATHKLMDKAMSQLRDECWAIKSYFENFLNVRKRDKNPYHLEQMKKYNIDYSDLNKLKELYETKAKVYHIYYCTIYKYRWGVPADEEYSYV
jgi:hypothetical protein